MTDSLFRFIKAVIVLITSIPLSPAFLFRVIIIRRRKLKLSVYGAFVIGELNRFLFFVFQNKLVFVDGN